jgi:hypothetical protein
VDVSNRNDGESSSFFSSRHLEVIHWDNGEARITEDMPDATVSPMPAKAAPAWIRAPDAFCPTVGANCRGFINRSAIGVGVWRFVEGGKHAERSRMVVAQLYPASDPATVARPYVLL